ncbi:MAG: hypothetical protein U0841_03460 [Chloroflexia bacterium]
MRLAGKVAVITGGGGPGDWGTTAGRFARGGRGWWWGMVIAERAEEVAARIVAAGGRRSGFMDVAGGGEWRVAERALGRSGRWIFLMNSGRSFGDDIREIDEGDLGIGILMWC